MLKQFLLTAAFSALALGAALAAEPASLSGDELRKAVSGKTVYLRISGFEAAAFDRSMMRPERPR